MKKAFRIVNIDRDLCGAGVRLLLLSVTQECKQVRKMHYRARRRKWKRSYEKDFDKEVS